MVTFLISKLIYKFSDWFESQKVGIVRGFEQKIGKVGIKLKK